MVTPELAGNVLSYPVQLPMASQDRSIFYCNQEFIAISTS